MWSPWSEADPAEVCLAALVLALHVVATPVLLDCGAALWTLLRVRRQPVACLAVVLALLQPLLDQDAVHLMSINEVNDFDAEVTGSCQFSAQPKQKEWPQSQVTSLASACFMVRCMLFSNTAIKQCSLNTILLRRT